MNSSAHPDHVGHNQELRTREGKTVLACSCGVDLAPPADKVPTVNGEPMAVEPDADPKPKRGR